MAGSFSTISSRSLGPRQRGGRDKADFWEANGVSSDWYFDMIHTGIFRRKGRCPSSRESYRGGTTCPAALGRRGGGKPGPPGSGSRSCRVLSSINGTSFLEPRAMRKPVCGSWLDVKSPQMLEACATSPDFRDRTFLGVEK